MTTPCHLPFALVCAIVFSCASAARSQLLDDNNKDAVRVTVAINADGSRTTYQFNNERHQATATTTSTDGKPMGKTIYQLDDASRFVTGVFFGPDKKFRFKSIYKYDGAGRLEQEIHLGKNDAVVNKIVYKYDQTGKRTGYSVYDASGKLLGSTSPSPSKSKSHDRSGR
jgi:hypothetical protein